MIFSTHLNIVFMSLSVSHDFRKPTNEPQKNTNLAKKKIKNFAQNHQKSTNIGFCNNFINRSLKCQGISSHLPPLRITPLVFWKIGPKGGGG